MKNELYCKIIVLIFKCLDISLLDLSGQELRKLPKHENSHIIKVLDVRKNCLQKLENVEYFTNLNEVNNFKKIL